MIILVAHVKGGVGKSTISVNVAAELQRQGKDTVLVQADPTVPTTANWARDREENGFSPITCLKQTGNLHSTLKDLDKRYDVVIVDAAGKDSKEMRTAMTAAHLLLAPMEPAQAELDSTEPLVETILQAKDFNPDLRVLGVFNKASTHSMSNDVEEGREYMAAYPEIPMAKVVLYQRKIYKKCLEDGRGVVELNDGKAKGEVQNLVKEML